MTTTPTSLSLSGVVDNSAIIASTHRNNYSAVQTAVNALITFLSAGTSTQFVQSGGGTTINWAGAYTAYTPAWTSNGTLPALGNGTIIGSYIQIGKLVQGSIELTIGSTSTFGTGNFLFSLPVAAYAVAGSEPRGQVTVFDTSAGAFYSQNAILNSSTTLLSLSLASPGVLMGATAPVTFATGDLVMVNFTYQAA